MVPRPIGLRPDTPGLGGGFIKVDETLLFSLPLPVNWSTKQTSPNEGRMSADASRQRGGIMVNGLTWVPSESAEHLGTRTVACIDVRLAGDTTDSGALGVRPAVLRFVLRQVEKVVRSGDRICPMATTRLAVEFAPVGCGVPPQILGARLAEAIGRKMPLDGPTQLAVSVGMATPEPRFATSDLTRRALSAARAGESRGRDQWAASGDPSAGAIVTVDRLLTPRSTSTSGRTFLAIHRRSIYRHDDGARGASTRAVPDRHPSTHWSSEPLTVLIADPMASHIGYPGLAAKSATSMAKAMGYTATAAAVSPDRPLIVDVNGMAIDLVVLVMDGSWVGQVPNWSTSAWGIPARLTSAYLASGTPVAVVSAGAGAGAVASCVAQGAKALVDLDHLPELLEAVQNRSIDQSVTSSESHLPPRIRSLVGLTVAERRVLYYLTEGWSAQEIADELVVSLTTVRSHIRSVLRKLGVRSQLAAVAIANSRDLEHRGAGDGR